MYFVQRFFNKQNLIKKKMDTEPDYNQLLKQKIRR